MILSKDLKRETWIITADQKKKSVMPSKTKKQKKCNDIKFKNWKSISLI